MMTKSDVQDLSQKACSLRKLSPNLQTKTQTGYQKTNSTWKTQLQDLPQDNLLEEAAFWGMSFRWVFDILFGF